MRVLVRGETLKGRVNPKGTPGFAYFEWTTDPNFIYSIQMSPYQAVKVTSTRQNFSAAVGGLFGGTKYYFRVDYLDTNNNQISTGPIISFVSPAPISPTHPPPSPPTIPPTLNAP